MATKNPEAEKAAKQKKILIVLGVGLLAVGGFQVPKLLGGKDTAAPAAEAAANAPATDTATATPVSTPAGPATAAPAPPAPLLPGEAGKQSPRTTLVGVAISSGSTVRATQGQLASFSLFKPKDPFKPQVTEGTGASDATAAAKQPMAPEKPKAAEPTAPAPEVTVADPTPLPDPAPVGGVGAVTDVPKTEEPVVPVEPPRYATVSVNGVAESLEVGGTFPRSEPLFVLAKVKPDLVRIGIAGGKLEKGATAPVEVGTSITLVDTASGVRYVVKVISVGSQPDLAFTSLATAAPVATPTTTTAGTP